MIRRSSGPAEQGGGEDAGPLGVESRPPLGLLEFIDLASSHDARSKQRVAFTSALLAEEIGYRRIWVPEHHGRGSPSANPLQLVSVIGSHTARVRVGSAVTLLRIRDPWLIAEDLQLAALFCGDRLDVGLGRGDLVGPLSAELGRLRKSDDALERDLRTLLSVLDGGSDLVEPLATPHERWLHGAGNRSADLASQWGCNYCHALFLNPDVDACAETLRQYRVRTPLGVTAVAVAVAANRDPARALLDARRQPFAVSAGSPQDCALVAVNVLLMTGADEVVIAEVSTDPTHHQAALRDVFSLVQESLQKGG